MVANPDQMNAHIPTEFAICALPRGKGEDRREHDEEQRKLQVEVQVQAGFKVRLHAGQADRCRTLPKSDSAHLQPAEVAPRHWQRPRRWPSPQDGTPSSSSPRRVSNLTASRSTLTSISDYRPPDATLSHPLLPHISNALHLRRTRVARVRGWRR